MKLDLPPETLPILQPLYYLDKSLCFDMHFKRVYPKSKRGVANSLESFLTGVLLPAIELWEQCCVKVADGAMDLDSAKTFFDHFRGKVDKRLLQKELSFMCPQDKVNERCKQISMLFALVQHERAATAVMKVKESYAGLFNGHFPVINTVRYI